MRIIAGSAKGHPLRAPPGRHTRPTSDRVREALFSMLEARLPDGLGGLQVLDLFAGSGALALEALSRGATRAVLVDSGRAAQRAILENAEALGFAAACTLLRCPVETALGQLARDGWCFELVLADPPYAADQDALLSSIRDSGLLAGGGLLVLEHAHRRPPGEISSLELLARRRHGDTELSIYRGGPGVT